MKRSHSESSITQDFHPLPLRAMIEQSTQTLELYGKLWQSVAALSVATREQAGLNPVTEAWLMSLQELLPQVQNFRLHLPTRAQLCHMLKGLEAPELLLFAHALLEHLASSLEPLLQAVLVDPAQARTWRPLLAEAGLLERPVSTLQAIRSQRRALPPVRKTATSRRREALA